MAVKYICTLKAAMNKAMKENYILNLKVMQKFL